MRITANIMNNNMLRNLQKNIGDLDELNQQLASGKKFRRPSQAPIEVVNGMQYDSLVADNEQYQSNVDYARNWIYTSEDAISSGVDVIQRGRELAIYGANGSLSPEDRENMAQEVKELRDELVSIANTKMGDKYLFSGQATNEKAIIENPDPAYDPDVDPFVLYNGDYNNINREINPGVKLNINVNAEEVFKDGIEYLDDLYNNLVNGIDQEEIANSIDDLGDITNEMSAIRAEIGAKVNRLEMIENRLGKENTNLKELRSKNEEVDLAEVITSLKMEENIYRASLASGARVMQPTLVDFLQ